MYKECNAFMNRKTWVYVQSEPRMNVVPYLWTFRDKFIDLLGKRHICKAWRELQTDNIDFDPEGFYSPIASHLQYSTINLILFVNKSILGRHRERQCISIQRYDTGRLHGATILQFRKTGTSGTHMQTSKIHIRLEASRQYLGFSPSQSFDLTWIR